MHYRLVDTQDLDAVSAAVKVVLAEHSELRKTEGKKVYDLQPRMNWNKAKALLWLLDAIQLPRDQVFPLYLGDDLTDEYAFHVLQDIGLGIVVEEVCRFTWARFVLKNPHEVHQFLKSLIQLLRKYTQ